MADNQQRQSLMMGIAMHHIPQVLPHAISKTLDFTGKWICSKRLSIKYSAS